MPTSDNIDPSLLSPNAQAISTGTSEKGAIIMTPDPEITNPENDRETAKGPSENDAASSKSSSIRPKSQTSTIANDQTPFVEFSVQVRELCHVVWPSSSKERRTNGSGKRLLGVLRSKKAGRSKQQPPPQQEFLIERMTGGTFNRIVGITMIGAGHSANTQMILRVPRMEWLSTPEREVAVLRYIRQHTSIPVAEVLAFDYSSNNPIQSPYVIQTRLPGMSLYTAAKQRELTTEHWCTIAREIGRKMLSLQNITNPTPGLIEACTNEDGSHSFSVCPFDIKSAYDVNWRQKVAEVTAEEKETALRNYEKSTLMFLATQFGRWRAVELRREPQGILYWDFMHRLMDAASQMDRVCCLGDDTNCLAHLDLAARNTMVEFPTDGSLKVTGVLDWDSAVFAPKFMSCAPPFWLWADEDDTEFDQNDESKANETPTKSHNQEIKRAFEETVGEDFLLYSYQPQFRLARRLFHIALTGNTGNMELDSIESFLADWAAFYKAEVEDYVPYEAAQDNEDRAEADGSVEGVGGGEIEES